MLRMLKNKKGEEKGGLPFFRACTNIGALVEKLRQCNDSRLKIIGSKQGYTIKYGKLGRRIADIYDKRGINYKGMHMNDANVAVYSSASRCVDEVLESYHR